MRALLMLVCAGAMSGCGMLGEKEVDLRRAERAAVLPLSGRDLAAAAFSSDGKLLATATRRGPIRVWSATTGTHVRDVLGEPRGDVVCLALGPNGESLACGTYRHSANGGDEGAGEEDESGIVAVWDLRGDDGMRVLGQHAGYAQSLAFGPDGSWLASAGVDNVLRAWDLSDGSALRPLYGLRQGVEAIATHRDGRRLITVSTDGRAMMWDYVTGRYRKLDFAGDRVVAVSPDACLVAAQGDHEKRPLEVWRVEDSRRVLRAFIEWPGRPAHREWIVFTSDARLMAATDGEAVKLWDVSKGTELGTIAVDEVDNLVFSPDGRRLLIARDEAVFLWHLDYGGYRESVD
jgi:WD40 repeat protein